MRQYKKLFAGLVLVAMFALSVMRFPMDTELQS